MCFGFFCKVATSEKNEEMVFLPASKMLKLAKIRQDLGPHLMQFHFSCFIFRILTSHTVTKISSFTVF